MFAFVSDAPVSEEPVSVSAEITPFVCVIAPVETNESVAGVVTLAANAIPPVPDDRLIAPVEPSPIAALIVSLPAASKCVKAVTPSVDTAALSVKSPPAVLMTLFTVKSRPASIVTDLPAVWFAKTRSALTVRSRLASITNDPFNAVKTAALTERSVS